MAFLAAWMIGRSSFLRSARAILEILRLVVIAAAATQPVLGALVLMDIQLSRITVVMELGLVVVLLLVTTWRVPLLFQSISTGLALSAALLMSVESGKERRFVETRLMPRFVSSSYHDLRLIPHRVGPGIRAQGGALQLLEESRLLLVDADAGAKIFDIEEAGLGLSREVDLNIPMNKERYIAAGDARDEYFRVNDIEMVDRDGDFSLVVTHSYWNEKGECYTARLSEAPWDTRSAIQRESWTTRFESQPCVQIPGYTNQQGGRIAKLDAEHLLFSVGSLRLEDYDPERLIESDYARLFKLNHSTWKSERFSEGHRNVQGLAIANGLIWATEHGPFGGDELNLIREGLHYGWPQASYGTDYTGRTLKLGKLGDHSGYERPIYSWTPSLGISNLIQVESPRFPHWKGDLLIGSLWGQRNGLALFRVRIREGRAIVIERIPVDSRVRDLIEFPDGRLALWDGRDRITVVDVANQVISACTGCHPTRNGTMGIGPSLFGIVGAEVARHADYAYSQSMRDFGGDWTKRRLDAFIADPAGVVPGTTMAHEGISDPERRRELIEFLQQISD